MLIFAPGTQRREQGRHGGQQKSTLHHSLSMGSRLKIVVARRHFPAPRRGCQTRETRDRLSTPKPGTRPPAPAPKAREHPRPPVPFPSPPQSSPTILPPPGSGSPPLAPGGVIVLRQQHQVIEIDVAVVGEIAVAPPPLPIGDIVILCQLDQVIEIDARRRRSRRRPWPDPIRCRPAPPSRAA